MNDHLIADGLELVETTLKNMVESDIALLQDASRHTIGAGGKRLRPRMALLAYLAAGGQDVTEAAPAAAAVELVHTATLVHDDINDHSLTRRGQTSVHGKWGRTFALLTGDFLFAQVYALMAPYGTRANVIMSQACVRLVEGETLQAAAAKSGTMDRETYKQIISRKTASLFEAAAELGGVLAGGEEKVVAALREYAGNLGMAFQIVDDILDLVGNPETMGKPVGTDLVQARGALVVEAARNGHSGTNGHTANGHAATTIATAPVAADPVQEMMAKLRGTGAVEMARRQARELANRARRALAQVPPSPARDELDALIDLVLDRDR